MRANNGQTRRLVVSGFRKGREMDNYLFVFVADTHCGSSMGLIKPDPFPLHDGGEYNPSPLQNVIWSVWEAGWSRVAQERKGKKLIIVHVGDASEGLHHQTTQIISSRIEEHEQIHIDCMDWAMQKAKFNSKNGDALYYISGTEEHAGNGSRSEENIAKDLDGVVSMNENRHTWDLIRKEIYGVEFDISHHGGNLGNSIMTDTNPLYNRLKIIYSDCLDTKQTIPDVWVRAHIHRYGHALYEGRQKAMHGFILPCFQASTGYVYRRYNNRRLPLDIGMVWMNVDKSGIVSWDKELLPLVQDKTGKWE